MRKCGEKTPFIVFFSFLSDAGENNFLAPRTQEKAPTLPSLRREEEGEGRGAVGLGGAESQAAWGNGFPECNRSRDASSRASGFRGRRKFQTIFKNFRLLGRKPATDDRKCARGASGDFWACITRLNIGVRAHEEGEEEKKRETAFAGQLQHLVF
jgi:hypothetical protein